MRFALITVLLICVIYALALLTSSTHASRSKVRSHSKVSAGDLRVGSFNIQVFGVKKMSDPAVVKILVSTLSRYDICLVQEIRDASGESIHQLVAKLNESSGKKYKVVLSERLGRTNSKEAYAYVYDPSKILIVGTYQYPSAPDQFERPPFSVLIQSVTNRSQKWFFTGVHISPSKAPLEINNLYEVYKHYAKDSHLKPVITKNWLLMGDFNADCSYMKKSDWTNNLFSIYNTQFKYLVYTGQGTTVSGSNCAYDRFVTTHLGFTPQSTKVNIFKFDKAYSLAPEFAKKVSDHFPIEMSISGW